MSKEHSAVNTRPPKPVLTLHILTPHVVAGEFPVSRTLGHQHTDPSDASGTPWLDVGRREWSGELLQACDMTQMQVPPIEEGSRPAGVERGSVATELGLLANAIVAAGGGDTATSALGVDAAESGDALLSPGTSGVLSVVPSSFGRARISGLTRSVTRFRRGGTERVNAL
jgi:sugar (pentulose or hexulose) kinase